MSGKQGKKGTEKGDRPKINAKHICRLGFSLMKGFSMKTISPALHFIQPWGIACNLALGMCLSFSATVCAQNSAEHEKPALLMFLESLDCGSIPPVSIPSKERCEALPDDSQRESAQAARDFCEDALNKLSGVSCRDIQELLAVIEKLSHLQSWCLKTPGYGNLLLKKGPDPKSGHKST